MPMKKKMDAEDEASVAPSRYTDYFAAHPRSQLRLRHFLMQRAGGPRSCGLCGDLATWLVAQGDPERGDQIRPGISSCVLACSAMPFPVCVCVL
jgi:hypothetical protein